MNNECFTEENTKNLTLIGRMKNNWRQRNVYIYQHPIKIDKVVSIGYPYFGGDPVVCVEDKAAFLNSISIFPEIYIYG